MTLFEKLERITEDRKLTVVSRRAGLPATAISSYLSKRQTPSCVVALRIARALNVSLEWLVDDSQGWPPVFVTPEHRAAVA